MTAHLEPVLREATPQDLPAMIAVIERAFDHWPAFDVDVPPIEHLRWKTAPHDGLAPRHLVAEIDQRIVAVRLRWESRIQIGPQEYVSETGADFAVDPEFQGRGLSRLLSSAVHDALVANPRPGFGTLSNAPQVQHMNEPGLLERTLTVWHRAFTPRAHAAVHFREGGLGQLGRLAATAASSRLPSRHHASTRIELIGRFDERTDALWERARRSWDVITSRHSSYLNWRFERPASGNGDVLLLADGDRASAYAVLRYSAGQAALVDLLWDREERGALRTIVQAALARARNAGATGLDCALPAGHTAEGELRHAGFAVVGEQTMLLGSHDSGENPPEAIDLMADRSRSMHLTMSDFDQH